MSDSPTRWECGNCGHAFYDGDGWDQWFCSECGEEMEEVAPEGYTPNEELQALVEEWKTDAKHLSEGKPEQTFAAGLVNHKAKELERVIEDYE